MASAHDRAALPRNELLRQWTQHAACADAELDACATELRQARHVQRAWAAGGVVGDAAQRAQSASERCEAAECLSSALWSVLEERAKLLGDDDMVDAATSSALDAAHARATRAWRILSSLRGLTKAAQDVSREVDREAVPWLNARYKARQRASGERGEPLLALLLKRGGMDANDAHPVADATWWTRLAQDGAGNEPGEVPDAAVPSASDDATMDHRLAAACVVGGDVALRRAVKDGAAGSEAVRLGARALQATAAAVFLPSGVADVAAVCWGLDVADGLALEARDAEGLNAARAAFSRAAPLAADLGSHYGDAHGGLRLALARRIGRLAELDATAALFALASLADGDDARFAVARSVAHSRARRPDRALQVLRAADDKEDAAALSLARIAVFARLWRLGEKAACAQLPVTFRDEQALARALAPLSRSGDRVAGDCLVAALLRRRRVADAQRLRPFASPRALKALDVAKASHGSAEPLDARYCPYLDALEQGASAAMVDDPPPRVDVWPAAPDSHAGEDAEMRERALQQHQEDADEDEGHEHEGPARVVAAAAPRFSFSLPPAPPTHTIFDGITGGEEKHQSITSPVDAGRADARAALEARIRDRVDALRRPDVDMAEAAPAVPEPMKEDEVAPEPMDEEPAQETELSDDPIEDSEEDAAAPAEDAASLGDDDAPASADEALAAPGDDDDDDDDDDDRGDDDGNDAPAPVAAAPESDLHAWPNNAAESQTQSQGADSQATVLELHVGGAALDATTGNACRVVGKAKGWWTIQFPGEAATHSRRAKQLTPRADDAAANPPAGGDSDDNEETLDDMRARAAAPPETEVLQAMLDEDEDEEEPAAAPALAPTPRRSARSPRRQPEAPAVASRTRRGSSGGSPAPAASPAPRRSSRSRSSGGRAASPAPAAAPSRRSTRGRAAAPAPAAAPRRSSRGRSAGGSASPAPAPAAAAARRSSRGRAPAAASSTSPAPRRSSRGRSGGRSASPAAPTPAPAPARRPRRTAAAPAPAAAEPPSRRSTRGRRGDENEDSNPAPAPVAKTPRRAKPAAAPLRRSSRVRK